MSSRRPLGFTGSRLSHVAEERSEETLGRALADPAACFLVRAHKGWLAKDTNGADPLWSAADLVHLGGDPAEAVLLGWTETGAPRLALALGDTEDPSPSLAILELRRTAMEAFLPANLEADLGQAEHLLNWHRGTRFCGLCGAETRPAMAGYRRDCTGCGHTHFPRTDPVVIMLVHDGEGRCVLGRQPHFRAGMWSCLAGFVEPGETIEDAVRREVREEVGLDVGPVGYASSQPWPFPGSLMIGMIAEAERGTLRVQESELEAARWVSREELALMLERRHPDGLELPPPYAIAHDLARRYAMS